MGKSELQAKVAEFFGENSPLKAADKVGGPVYEHRPQQMEMARLSADALEGMHNLCVEAPTGVGKSFAYLVPAIYFSHIKKARVVISTETISLQEQLINKDIPVIRELMGIDFIAVIAKGRSNYLCLRRLDLIAGEHGSDFLPFEKLKPQAFDLQIVASTLSRGSRTDIPFDVDGRVWESVCCELGNCMSQKCGYFGRCFYWRERKNWDKADLIIANHALLFTDLKIKELEDSETSLLPNYDALVFDEAHTLEDCAAKHLGLKVSHLGLKYLLSKLFDPERGRGVLMRSGEGCIQMRSVVADAFTASEHFFADIEAVMDVAGGQEMRVREPGVATNVICDPMNTLETSLTAFIRLQEDEIYRQELSSLLLKCSAFNREMQDFIGLSRPEHVYWIERKIGKSNVTLSAAPLNVNSLLREMLFSRDFSVILTSATLSIDGSLDYFRDRTGFYNGAEVAMDSPFDYNSQMRIYASSKIPLPDSRDYEKAMKDNIVRFVQMTHGKAFVLFTSYSLLNKMAAEMREFFSSMGIRLLVQGESGNRTAMLDEFRKDVNSVLFGTSSFWMGVDVPGESLSNVIITKLPFSVPTHPLVQARAEEIEKAGNSSFMMYQLPEAVLRFKQGAGRLIRTKKDQGIIVILDSRVLTKHYGKMFINSIPPCPIERF